MQYLLAIYEDHSAYDGEANAAAMAAIVAAHQKLSGDLAKAGVIRGGEGLAGPHAATTIRTRSGSQTVHDGPYAETAEQLGGFYIIEVDTLDEAMRWARQIPMAGDGSVEIRPLLDTDGGA